MLNVFPVTVNCAKRLTLAKWVANRLCVCVCLWLQQELMQGEEWILARRLCINMVLGTGMNVCYWVVELYRVAQLVNSLHDCSVCVMLGFAADVSCARLQLTSSNAQSNNLKTCSRSHLAFRPFPVMTMPKRLGLLITARFTNTRVRVFYWSCDAVSCAVKCSVVTK